ncbi:MAG: sigma 54-interacting transcriptional regulator [Phycisphaerales bacterium]|nr:MAG: sigma 54-interacting transcriptional regulator [Phycisphaerales bacterium]
MPDQRVHTNLSPQEVATILDSIADGVFTVDHDFIITTFNRAAERITGFAAAEAIGEHCYNIFRAPVCQTGCLLAESIRTGRQISGLELTILNRRNEEVPISISTAVLRNEDGEVIGGVETFRDLTAVQRLRQEMRRRHTLHDMVSKNHRMQEIFALVSAVAASDAAVLIEGETGTGKELLAKAIHEESLRREGPFVKVNCGALPDTLLESELFGHVAGAFTDAKQARVGRFESADGGTIFLDEIGDTSPAMQVKLLRVLQEGTFEPVGSSETRTADVRIIAATHQDLKERLAAGTFRQDLYYRINTVRLSLPPLRERREDIPLLVEHFIERFNGLTGKDVRQASPGAMQAMMRYAWPGNIRELEHAIERAFVLVDDSVIRQSHLPTELSSEQLTAKAVVPAGDRGSAILEIAERQAIEEVLRRHGGNKSAACEELGMSRTTLWRKIRKLGIEA